MEEELIRSGLSSFMEENYTTAISYFSKALEKNPDNKDAFLYRGCTYNKIGDYTSALSDLNSAEKQSGANFDISFNKAIANFHNSELKETASELSKCEDLKELTDEQKEKILNLRNKLK